MSQGKVQRTLPAGRVMHVVTWNLMEAAFNSLRLCSTGELRIGHVLALTREV